jgi:hypothetical protein
MVAGSQTVLQHDVGKLVREPVRKLVGIVAR